MNDFTNLKRYPQDSNSQLLAFDAADELILSENFEEFKDKKILIMGDNFGALTSKLIEFSPTVYNDSYVSSKAIKINCKNDIAVINDLENLKGPFDLVVLRLPKNLSFFEDMLMTLTSLLTKDAKVICTSMIKHMSKGHFDLINKYIGETTTSLAKKKARLIYANYSLEVVKSTYPIQIEIPEWKEKLINQSNLFSREKLDIGTRFLLENIPTGEFQSILDIGCANGIVGLLAKKKNPNAKIIFTDDSFMAIKSAKENYELSYSDEAEYLWTNCYEEESFENIDLVLCNPPFHQGNTIGDFIAWQMFVDSKKKLNTDGMIRVIGNKHLAYNSKLKKLFKKVEIIKQNKKFMIIDAYK
ncbi:hypothetical protein A9Q84_01430 [Halobacteriovorax marinus]|uniref:Methyltransferase small domain-containing protein n=1 Tax=Halobacteriovorax marinus TaxID=97084 RepID=A0A1Y5FC64_9BACT|nr:hypothetical protein A9Q84_01430 [Halobacteriovorax marinus]